MDNNQKALSHFGVPGMKWGVRTSRKFDKKASRALTKANKLDAKGKKEEANINRHRAEILKERGKRAKEVGALGEQIRKGTSFMNKWAGQDVNIMTANLAKGKYTEAELMISNILSGRTATMNALIRDKIVNG